ncbi:hypothetical protein [Rhodomicrobium vannielii]|nr:hypothetical protein [Rhodomicrobium vannielii]
MGAFVPKGPYATVVPTGEHDAPHPDLAEAVARGHVPLLTVGTATSFGDLNATVADQDTPEMRAMHIAWKVQGGALPPVVLLGLTSANQSIMAALEAAGLVGIDPAARGILAFPLYAFPSDVGARITARLPVL